MVPLSAVLPHWEVRRCVCVRGASEGGLNVRAAAQGGMGGVDGEVWMCMCGLGRVRYVEPRQPDGHHKMRD